MSKNGVEKRLAALEHAFESIGVSPVEVVGEPTDPKERADYIAFGSPEHMGFLGLAEAKDEKEAAASSTYGVTHKSPKTGRVYYLVDELSAIVAHRELEPRSAIELWLRQKVSSFESGGPPELQSDDPGKPNFAATMWEPDLEAEARRLLGLPY